VHASDNLILITLLVKLGVAAAVASSLARSMRFKRLLLRGAERTRAETMALVGWILVPLTLGVLVRVRVPNFLAADLSFEGTILLALLFGPAAAFAGGVVLALPAVMHREYFALAVNLCVAAIFSTFREFVDEEDIWSFSPLIDSAHSTIPASRSPDLSPGADHGCATHGKPHLQVLFDALLRAVLGALDYRAGNLRVRSCGRRNPAEDMERGAH